jgi:HEAT repeat protein
MNKEFEHLYRQLVADDIDTSQFLRQLKSIGDCRHDLLAALRERYVQEDWRNVSRLIWAVGLMPDPVFITILCELMESHRDDGYMEGVADSLMEIADEKSVPCIIKALDYHVIGDDGRHFNRTLINALYKIGTDEAINAIKQVHDSDNELIRSHAEEFLSRLQ